MEGLAVVRDDPAAVAEAVRRYSERYQPPRLNPRRVVLEITLTRVLASRRITEGCSGPAIGRTAPP